MITYILVSFFIMINFYPQRTSGSGFQSYFKYLSKFNSPILEPSGTEFERDRVYNPTKLIARCHEPLISLLNDHVFTETLVEFNHKWYMYYGAADKRIEGMIIDLKGLLSEALKNKQINKSMIK